MADASAPGELPYRYYVTYFYANAVGTTTGGLNVSREFPLRDIDDVDSMRELIADRARVDGHPAPVGSVVILGWQRYETEHGVPAYAGALRRMYRDSTSPLGPPFGLRTIGYREAIRDLAHELGVDLDG